MMNRILIFMSTILIIASCSKTSSVKEIKVSNLLELNEAIKIAQAGDEIIMKNGVWNDTGIEFSGKGTANKPIVLRAEEEGKVSMQGNSFIKLAGEYLTVSGLYFRNGYSKEASVIEFRIDDDKIANHCKVTNCVIENFTKPDKYDQDHWIIFWGKHNELSNCYIAGKFNQGPTVKVYLKGNQHVNTYHQIINNHFGPRPRKGGPKAETIQIGDSETSMTPSFVNIQNNLFDRCNGEVEVVSNKSNYTSVKNNIFYQCEGSLVLRHGNYCTIDGNLFIGNDHNNFIGGIRIINTGHWITNNYFYKIKGEEFRSPLAIMNGIDKSPLNRYNQVTDVVVAHNTWVDCKSPWQFSVGANMDKRDVLPESEIRAARPLRCVMANNLIYNHKADSTPIIAYDKVDGFLFQKNFINNQGVGFENYNSVDVKNINFVEVSENLYIPESSKEFLTDIYSGYAFSEEIKTDAFGVSRAEKNYLGAMNLPLEKGKVLLDKTKFGATWFKADKEKNKAQILKVSSAEGDLATKIAEAKSGDILELTESEYTLNQTLHIDKEITIKSSAKATIKVTSQVKTAFELRSSGNLVLKNIKMKGENSGIVFAPSEKNMSDIYNLKVENCEIEGFETVFHAYKASVADSISFSATKIMNCENGIVLAAETDDQGDYNAEVVLFTDCEFENIQTNVINFYRGGYDESTIGGNLYITNCKFSACAKKEPTKILIQTRGIVNVGISKNTFTNNSVKQIAVLWGEKNNKHSENTISNSGEILVEEFLKQKLVY